MSLIQENDLTGPVNFYCLWKVRVFCLELSKLNYQPTDQAFDPGLVFTSALISLIYYTK